MGLEIISGVERRRRWSAADKLRIVAEADEPGAKVAEVARRHEVSRSILWTWRKQARAGELTAPAPLNFCRQSSIRQSPWIRYVYGLPLSSGCRPTEITNLAGL